MALYLNENILPYKDFRTDQTRQYREQLPLLLAGKDSEGKIVDIPRVPIWIAHVFDRRLHSPKPDWKNNYFDASDFFGYAGKKTPDNMKIILTVDNKGKITENGRRVLESITSETELCNGALDATGLYEEVGGISLSRSEVEKYGIEKDLSKQEVLDHPVWRVILRHPDAVPAQFAYDKAFMQEVVNATFADMKTQFKYEEGMGVYLGSPEKVPTFRAAIVSRLEFRSWLNGWCNLDFGRGRLVGLAPEALNAPGKVIESVK